MWTTRGLLLDDTMPLPPGAEMEGYAFPDADCVIGTVGLQAYAKPLPLHSDGNYLMVEPLPDALRISADAAGYRHLFYYSDGPLWAIAESFVALAEHLCGRGVALAESKAHVGALLSRKQFFQQLTTRHTAIDGIRLLRRDETLRVGRDGLRVTHHPRPAAETYEAGLHRFLETWLSRILTLQSIPDHQLFFHLSGGLDSRAVTAFHLYLARHHTGPTAATVGVHALSDARHAVDYDIAQQLAAATGVELGGVESQNRQLLNLHAALDTWQRVRAGAYTPLRLPGHISDPRDIHLTGHGGGGFKRPLDARGIAAFRAEMRAAYGYFGHGDRTAWEADFEAELTHLLHGGADQGEVLNLFGRASRARFHSGQAASYKTQVSPFDSALAEAAADARPASSRQLNQFHYDIMSVLAPDLLDVAFDDARKAPTDAHRAALPHIAPLHPQARQIFGRFAPEASADQEGSPLLHIADYVTRHWADLPRQRTTWLFRWKVRRLLAKVGKGRAPDAVALRHLHVAWLLIHLRRIGVMPAA